MRTLTRRTTDPRSLEAARRRAATAPGARLPCPVCATSLKGANLARHLGATHPDLDAGARPPGQDGTVVLVGVDRRIRRTVGVLAVAWLALVAVVVALAPGPITDDGDPTAAEIAGAPFVTVVAVGLLVGGAVLVLQAARAFRARLTVTPDEIRLRHRLGTGERRVPLPAAVETGTLFTLRPATPGTGSEGGVDVAERAGAYLRIGDGRRAITVGCPHATGLRRHWSGWRPGARRKWWDVNLSAAAFVELQYALAPSGTLAAPAPDRAGGAAGGGR